MSNDCVTSETNIILLDVNCNRKNKNRKETERRQSFKKKDKLKNQNKEKIILASQ